jgi:hypothetical protein
MVRSHRSAAVTVTVDAGRHRCRSPDTRKEMKFGKANLLVNHITMLITADINSSFFQGYCLFLFHIIDITMLLI